MPAAAVLLLLLLASLHVSAAAAATASLIGHGVDERANGTATFSLSEREREGIGRLFAAVDGDDDGSVDVIELRTFLRFLDDENAEDGATDDDDDDDDDAAAAKLFAAHDVDGDARLSAAEFQSALVRWSSEMEEASAEKTTTTPNRSPSRPTADPPRRARAVPADYGPWRDREEHRSTRAGGRRGARTALTATGGGGKKDALPRDWTHIASRWEKAVASSACVLCVTGHPKNCGPPSPPGCEDPEFQRVGVAAEDARRHAALIGGFLRKHGLTHE